MVFNKPQSFGLFAFSEDFVAVVIADVLESCFYELACLFFGASNGCCEVIVFEAYELCVEHSVVEGVVAEYFFNVEDAFGFVVFHCGFPVTKGVKSYLC